MVGYLEKINAFLNRLLLCIAGMALAGMVFLTCSNIFIRIIWFPIKGSYELMGFFGAIVTAFALGYTQMRRGHVGIDIVVNQFSARTQRILNGVNYFICTLFFALAGWQIAVWGTTIWRTGEVTETLRIIFYPFIYGVALGCFILCLVFLVDLVKVLLVQEGAS
ncbi:MAG: TRAP transporter small permease subunit [Proteobacteria bacterium]|nr:TRAP transporter small permease subunit [Pseudomonadota bacterium]